MQPVDCLSCGQRVLVEKYSPIHTGIQWPAPDSVLCPYRGGTIGVQNPRSLTRTCDGLSDAVRVAVRNGSLHESHRPEGLSEHRA